MVAAYMNNKKISASGFLDKFLSGEWAGELNCCEFMERVILNGGTISSIGKKKC